MGGNVTLVTPQVTAKDRRGDVNLSRNIFYFVPSFTVTRGEYNVGTRVQNGPWLFEKFVKFRL